MYIKYTSMYLSKSEPFILACSGGPDSMAALHFLGKGGHNSHGLVLFIDHGTLTSNESFKILSKYCKDHSWTLIRREINTIRPQGKSYEEHWRDERYRLFGTVARLTSINKIITAHHLDDAVETYLFNSLNGKGYTMPESRLLLTDNNYVCTVVRPFMENTKESLLMFCHEHNVPYYDDPTNHDLSNMRSYIRKNIVPQALYVNPGLYTVVLKMIRKHRLTAN